MAHGGKNNKGWDIWARLKVVLLNLTFRGSYLHNELGLAFFIGMASDERDPRNVKDT